MNSVSKSSYFIIILLFCRTKHSIEVEIKVTYFSYEKLTFNDSFISTHKINTYYNYSKLKCSSICNYNPTCFSLIFTNNAKQFSKCELYDSFTKEKSSLLKGNGTIYIKKYQPKLHLERYPNQIKASWTTSLDYMENIDFTRYNLNYTTNNWASMIIVQGMYCL